MYLQIAGHGIDLFLMNRGMSVAHTQQNATEQPTEPAEHRRRWSVAEKLAIVRESFEPGKSVTTVANRYDVNRNQLSGWRKLYRDQVLLAMKAEKAEATDDELHRQ
ncbi:transposase [Burkholderia sp. Bp9126]|nr:transposase [Burkholderia sp. Bp9126]